MKSTLKRVLSSPAFIVGFAFLIRVLLIYLGSRTGPKPVRDDLPYGLELGRVARAIAAGQGFSSPLLTMDSGATAWFTPIYPYLVAGIFKIWGIYSDMSRPDHPDAELRVRGADDYSDLWHCQADIRGRRRDRSGLGLGFSSHGVVFSDRCGSGTRR